MKVSLTLKKIIKAKVRPRPVEEGIRLINDACTKVVRAHRMTAKVARMRKLREELSKLQDELSAVGVHVVYPAGCAVVSASEKFLAAGGVYPPAGGPDAVINQLAAATPREGRAILKSHGIDWS